MIRFFPSLFPDETMYSIFVRYGKETKSDNDFYTIKQLLGKMHLRVTPQFTGNLDYMCSQLPRETDYTPDYFIDNHTILPLFKPFVPTERYLKATSQLKEGSLIAVYSGLGLTAGSFLQSNGIKYCPQCMEEDRSLFKKAYLHRIHQVPGVFVCSKHACLLKEVEVSIDSRNGLLDINEYEEKADKWSAPKLTDEILSLSNDVGYLMSNYEKFGDFELVKKKYLVRMHDKDYISPSGLINQVKLQKDFLAHYSDNFLELLNSSFNVDDESSWLRVLTRQKIKVVHPIRHLLFIRFLFGDLESFLLYSNTEYRPFGVPPFPCLNSQSEHYKELVIKDCQITTNHRTSRAKGTFICQICGFKYTLDKDTYDESGFERVKFRKAVRQPYNQSHNKELEDKYKKEIESVLINDPFISRRKILSFSNKAYRWLYKHDRDWLESRIAGPLEHKEFYKNTRVNWEERDKDTLIKVKQAVETIYKETIPVRITVQRIAQVCHYGGLRNDLIKMPLTQELVSSYEEKLEHYHKRKIDAVIEKLIREERELVRHVILREAGIPDKYYHDYDDYIKTKSVR